MKKSLSLLLAILLIGLTSNARTYYFAANGNDANSGTSTSSPWKTLNKFNSVFSALSPGDFVLFNRGDIFYGTLVISKSGSSGAPITIGAYGSGANPVISGFTNVTAWTNLGNNIWESSSVVSTLSACNIVIINGNQVAMGRYPNSGYLTYQSFSGNSSITSSSINSGSTNWTGAEAVIRKNDWVLDRCTIKSHSGSTINYADPYTSDNAIAGFGFFIQNDSRTLDQQNEWYYNSSTKKIRIYSSGTPSNVQISTVSNLLSSNGYDNITVDGLSFTGSSDNTLNFYGGSADYLKIQNCTLNFCGQHGIYLGNGKGCVINNNTISNCNMAGVESSTGSGNSITSNTISNIGIIPGQGNYSTHSDGIYAASTGVEIRYNTIQNVSYNGIFLSYVVGNAIAQYNFIDKTNVVLDDGGGIYASGYGTGTRTIDHNIVLNTIGNKSGAKSTTVTSAGIYLDEPSSNVTVTNNTVANGLNCGIKMHKAKNNIVDNNTSFNNANWQIYFQNASSSPLIYGNIMKNNIFFSKTSTQWVLGFVTLLNDLLSFGTSDSNYYARPIDDNVMFNTYQPNTNYKNINLAGWQLLTGKDAHSKGSPKKITNVNDIRFEYNATKSNKTIALDANYIDAKNVSYNGSITLAPYTSAVLIKNGAATGNQSPTANAGNNQTVTLPSSTALLSGSGSDPDGTISAYNWTKTSGPSGGSVSSPNSAATNVTGLVQGIYQFQLKVTDNKGATAISTVQVTVNPAGSGTNQVPVANAGTNQAITLPTNTILLSGSGSDVDGSISAYNWTKISGPSVGYISNANTATTNITGLTQGTYVYQLEVTDNDGATATSSVQITVNPVGTILNQSPIVSAGNNQNIALPAKTALLSGSASDADGRVTTYKWSKISGPSSDYFSNSNTAATYVNNLTEGTYVYQLKVTDNGGATATSNVQITVGNASSGGANLLAAVNPANTVNGIDYKYYKKGYNKIPSFSSLKPTYSGSGSNISLIYADRSTSFTFNFTGYVNVPADGEYTFYTSSDDGSNLYIDNVLVVDNDGLHGLIEKSGTIGLKAGKHAISVGYIQGGVDKSLQVSYAGPGVSKQTIPSSALYRVSTASAANPLSISTNSDHKISSTTLEVGVKAYPNPFTNQLQVRINSENAGDYKMDLIDASGRTIWTAKGDKNTGTLQKSINTSNLPEGIYYLKVVQNNNSSTIKLIK